MIPIEIGNFFLAMQAGRIGADRLRACFAPDATYSEPFTGQMRHHKGRDDIMAAMALGWEMPMVDTRLVIDNARTEGAEIHLDWTCISPSLPGGKGQGHNHFVMQDGLITALTTTLKQEA